MDDQPIDPMMPPDSLGSQELATPGQPRKQLSIELLSKPELYSAFLSFVDTGGIFIASRDDFKLGEEVSLTLSLINESEPLKVDAKVIWLTPAGAQGGMRAGVGVQFIGEEGEELRRTIETQLAGMLNSDIRTDTM